MDKFLPGFTIPEHEYSAVSLYNRIEADMGALMNIFLFCLIFLQVSIFLIGGFYVFYALCSGESAPSRASNVSRSIAVASMRVILTPTELEYFRRS